MTNLPTPLPLIHYFCLLEFLLFSVATRDIEPGEEFLLDYGAAYNTAFLLPQGKSVNKNIEAAVLESELPGGLVDEDVRDDSEEVSLDMNGNPTTTKILDDITDKMMPNFAV